MTISVRSTSAERDIRASAPAIFAVLTDIDRHCDLDGSGMVQGAANGPHPLVLGSRFTMGMRRGRFAYRSVNTVVEFELDRLIAWATVGEWRGRTLVGGHRWRYQLEPRGAATLVTETYDWSTARLPRLTVELPRFPERMRAALPATLERLAALVEDSSAG